MYDYDAGKLTKTYDTFVYDNIVSTVGGPFLTFKRDQSASGWNGPLHTDAPYQVCYTWYFGST